VPPFSNKLTYVQNISDMQGKEVIACTFAKELIKVSGGCMAWSYKVKPLVNT